MVERASDESDLAARINFDCDGPETDHLNVFCFVCFNVIHYDIWQEWQDFMLRHNGRISSHFATISPPF
jgi:hypothetical protein